VASPAPVLVIAPHGLDEVLGCGGATALHVSAGRKVFPLILAGDGAGHDAKRREAAGEAAAVLGAKAPAFLGFPGKIAAIRCPWQASSRRSNGPPDRSDWR
jgi:LmbE family N-acetylglucosaminyl deacetylase